MLAVINIGFGTVGHIIESVGNGATVTVVALGLRVVDAQCKDGWS